MNSSENYSSSSVSPPGDELLQEMMPKLGLETTAPKEKYKNKALASYFLPRVLILCLVIALIGAVIYVLLMPVQFHDLKLTESPDGAVLDFRLDRMLLFENVTADLDGRPLTLTDLGDGAYELNMSANGELTVVARTFTGRRTTVSMFINCIDDEAPFVVNERLFGGYYYIYLSDGDKPSRSGVNWQSVRVTLADSGEEVEGFDADPQAGYVCFLPSSDESVRIYVEDMSGNPSSFRLDPSKSDKD